MPPPTVRPLASTSTGRPAHHVASVSLLPARITLRRGSADNDAAAASSAASLQPRPTGFCNPWPSYRAASINDAWLAYQRGAAIAPHALTLEPDEADELLDEDEADGLGLDADGDPVASGAAARRGARFARRRSTASNLGSDDGTEPVACNTSRPTKLKLYVRPELARVVSGDSADDWRDPPVRVVRPDFARFGGADANDDERARLAGTRSSADGGAGWGDAGGAGDGEGRRQASVTWLGHAGALVRVPLEDGSGHAGVLFDPIFSYRCSPSQYVGPARYLPPPCAVSELPDIHVCCISHDHYDHLDYYTVLDLWKYHCSTIHFFVPLGLAQWFTSSGIPEDRVTELDWYDEALVAVPSAAAAGPAPARTTTTKRAPSAPWDASAETLVPGLDAPDADGAAGADAATGAATYPPSLSDAPAPPALRLKVALTPAQHRSGRGLTDQMRSLWGSWCVGVAGARADEPGMRGWDGFKVFFGGDTGYRYATAPEDDPTAICPAFQEIGDRYGPFSLALLPLSTGSSLPFLRSLLSLSLDQYTLTSSLHCSPADSLEIARVLGARRSLGIHWGTFCDADEARGTRVEFGRCRRLAQGVGHDWAAADGAEAGVFVVSDIGETLVFP